MYTYYVNKDIWASFIFFRSGTLLNYLSTHLRHTHSIKKFKSALTTHLLRKFYTLFVVDLDENRYIRSTSTYVKLPVCESSTGEIFLSCCDKLDYLFQCL